VTSLFEPSDLMQWSQVGQQSAPPENLVSTVEEIVSGVSSFVYWATGRADGYFTGGDTYTEVRDGNGSHKMYVLNGPIDTTKLSEVSVMVDARGIPQSSGCGSGGWFVEQGGSSIALRPGGGIYLQGQSPWWGRPFRFSHGIGNVSLAYPGGYSEVPEDLFLGCLAAGTVLLNRRLREDEGGRATPQTGSVTSYRSWAYPPAFRLMLQNYKRTSCWAG